VTFNKFKADAIGWTVTYTSAATKTYFIVRQNYLIYEMASFKETGLNTFSAPSTFYNVGNCQVARTLLLAEISFFF